MVWREIKSTIKAVALIQLVLLSAGAGTSTHAQTPTDKSDERVLLERIEKLEQGLAAAAECQQQLRVNLLRAYDVSSNSFSLNQATLVIENAPNLEKGKRYGLRLDLQYGQATETVQGNAANEPRPQVYRPVWQAYGTYVFDVGKGLTVDFGKFASALGYETNYTKDNSRTYLVVRQEDRRMVTLLSLCIR